MRVWPVTVEWQKLLTMYDRSSPCLRGARHGLFLVMKKHIPYSENKVNVSKQNSFGHMSAALYLRQRTERKSLVIVPTCVVVSLVLPVDVGLVDGEPERGAQLVQHLLVAPPEALHELGLHVLRHILTQDHTSVLTDLSVKLYLSC